MPGTIPISFCKIIPPLFLDEIQYAPEVIGAIKRRVDRNKQVGQYILSGSHNLAVLKSISESLAGRVAIAHLLPMTRQELAAEPSHDFLTHWLAGETPDLPTTIGSQPPPRSSTLLSGGEATRVCSICRTTCSAATGKATCTLTSNVMYG